MKTLPHELVTEAFALSRARGAELLVRLGDFNVWHGDLAVMRGDEPRQDEAEVGTGHDTRPARVLVDTLVLVRAIELLQPGCRAVLANAALLANDLAPQAEDAERIIADCRERLFDIYESLTSTSGDGETIPEWVAEREHAAAAGSRHRG